jgi:hypothetical protein
MSIVIEASVSEAGASAVSQVFPHFALAGIVTAKRAGNEVAISAMPITLSREHGSLELPIRR